MQKLIFLLLLAGTHAALAASGGHGEIPTATILWQAFNLVVVAGILYFATGKLIVSVFAQRQASFMASAKKADEARAEAEKQYSDIKSRLERLNQTRDENLSRAAAEAADVRKQLIHEAKDQAKRIRQEAEVTATIETQRAQRELQEKFVRDTINLARQVLAKDIGSADHNKLQNDFAKNIEAVSP
jgi:F-type H+-transporting ATPase subunit b